MTEIPNQSSNWEPPAEPHEGFIWQDHMGWLAAGTGHFTLARSCFLLSGSCGVGRIGAWALHTTVGVRVALWHLTVLSGPGGVVHVCPWPPASSSVKWA